MYVKIIMRHDLFFLCILLRVPRDRRLIVQHRFTFKVRFDAVTTYKTIDTCIKIKICAPKKKYARE